MFKILLTRGLKWMDLKEFASNKYSSNSPEGYTLEVDIEYPKDLRELHHDYPLASDKIEIKEEILSNY